MTRHTVLPVLMSNQGDRKPLDFYETPVRAIKAVLKLAALPPLVWEPCVGAGAIAKMIKEQGSAVVASDIHDYGYEGCFIEDLLTVKEKRADYVITNPPYKLAAKCIRQLLALDVGTIWMPLRLNFLEGKTRHDIFKDTRFASVYVFVQRLDFNPDTPENKSGGMLTFAWFRWDRTHTGQPTVGFINDLA